MAVPRKKRPPKGEGEDGLAQSKPAPGADLGVDEASPDQAKIERLNALGNSLARTKQDAINGRAASGIETIWDEDDEHYEGYDEVNRGQKDDWHTKEPGRASPKSKKSTQSTEFPNITAPFVDAAAAKVGGIILPTDERAWSIEPTPITDDLLQRSKGKLPIDVIRGMGEANVPEDKAVQVAQAEQASAQAVIDEAKEKADKAQKRIEDWHVESQFHSEMRKTLEDCCRIGSGVLKGPIPISRRAQMYRADALVVVDKIVPGSKRVDPRNFFPDPACGENIHNGNYTWERDYLTAKQLRELKRNKAYLADQIDLCLAEGPLGNNGNRKTADGKSVSDKDIFEIWYFHGTAVKEDLEAAGCKCDDDAVAIPAQFEMVNDRVIKGALNPLDSGAFPYDVMPWKRRKNSPWGTGVARQIRTPQRIVTAGTRVMLTNGGRAAGPVFVMNHAIERADGGPNNIEPWAVFVMPEDGSATDARAAMTMFEIPDRFNSLSGIVQFGFMLAEKVTGLPLMLQGQMGDAPDTLGGQKMMQGNASETLHRVALLWDDNVTEPHIRRYYDWLLQYGDDDEKGDFQIDARGSTSLVEREMYKNEVTQLLQASLNPAFKLDPAKVMEEHLRTTKKNPKLFTLTEEQQKQAAAAQQQQPQDTSLQVANVRAQTEMQKVEAIRKPTWPRSSSRRKRPTSNAGTRCKWRSATSASR
jgi:hypothetical protein